MSLSGNEIAKQSARGSLLLLLGNMTSNFILLLASLIIARLLHPEAYGTYVLALIPPTIFWLFTGLGLNTAVTRFAAYHISRGEVEEAKRISRNAISILLLIGAVMSLLDYLTAPFVSSVILHRPSLTPYVELSSIVVLGQAATQSAVSAFIGWSKYAHASITTAAQATTKVILSLFLILAGFGVFGAVLAQVVSYLAVGLIAVAVFFAINLRGSHSDMKQTMEDVRSALRFGLPSHIGSYISQFATQNYLVLVLSAIVVTTGGSAVGFFQAALNVTVAITVFSTSFASALLPAFASLEGKQANTSIAFTYAVKIVGALVLPIVVFVIADSNLLIRLFYGTAFVPAGNILALLSVSYVPMVIGLTVFPSYFNGIGKTRLTMAALLANAGIMFLLAPLLGLLFGTYGLAYAFIISNFATAILALILAKRFLGSGIDYWAASRTLIAGAVSYLALLGIARYTHFSLVTSLFFDLVVFLIVYSTILPITRAIDSQDVAGLIVAGGNLGILSRPLSWVLKYEDWIIGKSGGKKIAKAPTE